nr:UGT6 [Ginkgo biloba]|eukprot:Gb_38547 [translate_table: standard]
MEKRRGHVVVFSTLEQGHLIPCFQFCLNLAHRGLAITFVTTPLNASKLNPRLQQASSNGLPIRIEQLSLPPVQGLPPGHESCDTLPSSQMGNLYLATEQLQAPLEGLLQRLSQEDQPPTCVVGDMFTGWVTQTAVKLGFPAFTFLTSPAYGTLVYNSLWSHLPHLSTQSADIRVPDVPFVSVDRSELSPALQMADRSSPWHLFVSRQVKKNRLNHGHIVNTFHDLEPQMIEFMEKSTGKPVWSVGPVLPSDFINGIGISSSALSASERGKEATIEEKVCLEWLDEREAASVIYISFGSRNLVSPAQIEQLALGLEASGKPFIWAMRTCPQGEGEGEGEGAWESFLPPGFQERTKGRGLLIPGWAPQLLILSHPSTAAFISHCGWNSMLESLSRGIPIICWPLAGEQFLNTKWFVHHLGVALQVRRGEGGIVPQQEVERAVKLIMDDDEVGVHLRGRMQRLGQMARTAVSDGGTSTRNLDLLVDHILSLAQIHPTNPSADCSL